MGAKSSLVDLIIQRTAHTCDRYSMNNQNNQWKDELSTEASGANTLKIGRVGLLVLEFVRVSL